MKWLVGHRSENCTNAIQKAEQPHDVSTSIRQKTLRCNFHSPLAHIANRIKASVEEMGNWCRPYVMSAVLRTIWNGWPTSARMRSMSGTVVRTRGFGCATAEDRMDHYWAFSKAWVSVNKPIPAGLTLSTQRRNLQSMMLAEKGLRGDEMICIFISAFYAITRMRRHCRKKGEL